MSDAKGAREISVTIKYGKGYDETWAVFRGSVESVREDMADYFGIPRANVADQPLNDLVVNLTAMAHGQGNIARALGGTVIAKPPGSTPATTSASTPAGTPPWKTDSQAPSQDPWAGVTSPAEGAPTEAAPAEPEKNPLYTEIERITNVDSLKRLWAENKAEFADTDLFAAWKAKGQALQAAA